MSLLYTLSLVFLSLGMLRYMGETILVYFSK